MCFPSHFSTSFFRVLLYIGDGFSLIAVNRSSTGSIRMETSGRREALVLWSSWSTRSLARLGFSWGNPRHSRSVPIISVCALLPFSESESASSLPNFDFEIFLSLFLVLDYCSCTYDECARACWEREILRLACQGFRWWWTQGWAFLHPFSFYWKWVHLF